MKSWSIPFRVGYRDDAVHCRVCEREYIVRRPTVMLRLRFKNDITYCSFCGVKDIIVEDATSDEQAKKA